MSQQIVIPAGKKLIVPDHPEQVDQENTGVGGSYYAMFWGVGQSFTAGLTGILTGFDINLAAFNDRIVRVYSGEGTGGTLLYEETWVGGDGTLGQYLKYEFTSSISVTAGQKYTVIFENPAGSGSAEGAGMNNDLTGDNYAGGQIYLIQTGESVYTGYSVYDMLFRTYVLA